MKETGRNMSSGAGSWFEESPFEEVALERMRK